MRLHRLDTAVALRLAQSVLDRPAASVAARELARSTIAYLQAAQGSSGRSATAIAQVQAEAARWRTDMPYLQLPWSWPGAPGSRSPATWPASTRSWPTSSPTSPAPATSGSAPATWPSSRRTRPGCAGRATRPCRPASAPARCSPPAGSTPAWPTPNAPRRRRCAATPRRPRRRWPRRTAPTRRAWRCSTRGWSRPGARSLAAAGDLPGAVKHLGQLADRLRADGFAGHEVLVLLRPGPAGPGRRAGRPDLHRRRPAHRRATPGRALRAGRRGAAAAAGPARPRRGDRLPRRPARGRRRLRGAGLTVYAAEAAAGALHRLRRQRSRRRRPGRERLAGRCWAAAT